MAGTPKRRWTRWLTALVALVVVAGAGFWAGRVTFRAPTAAPTADEGSLTVAVAEQTVGKTFQYNVTVTRDRTPVAVNSLAGVVTRVSKSGSFKVGGVLYAVDGVPVRVVQGSTPFYRDLSADESGADVAQLRAALHTLGYLDDGSGNQFDWAAQVAVEAWQKALGIPQTGVVAKGELVAVAKLPAVLSLDASLWPGAVLAGGEQVVFENAGTPAFVLELGPTEAQQVSADATVTVVSGKSSWPAVITGQQQTPSGTVQFALAAPDGGVVCADQCDLLPADQETQYLLSKVSVVPPVTGPGVPVAAIQTKPDGSSVVDVVGADGSVTATPVTVLGSQDGVAVVDGLAVGEQVRVFGTSASASPGASPSPPSGSGTPR